jgi:serine/threonine protein kinase/peptidoglycan hydrolase-like protein with peptidoglycan-binding domain
MGRDVALGGVAEHATLGLGELRGSLPAGTDLRGYELVAVLGQGTFGITYLGRDARLDREVAIKEYLPTALALRESGTTIMPRSAALAEEFVWGRERFLDEARTLVRLEGLPAVVRVIDFLEANGTAYMVMALAKGEGLDHRLARDGTLPAAAIERLLVPLLDGLDQVHATGFLHRDIKPANIIVDATGRPTLIDFGAARAAMAGRSTVMTAIFTPGYAAPEQFTSVRQGPWTDIYGLAATLHHAVTGRPPPNAVDRMMEDLYEPLVDRRPEGYPLPLLAGIDAGLVPRAKDRPQSIAEWRALLLGAADPSHAPTVVLPRPTEVATVVMARATPLEMVGRKFKVPWRVTAVVAGLAVLGLGGYLALVPKPAPSIQELQSLTSADLERLLAERRAADAAAAETRRLEEEARLKAEADAEAKRQADVDLDKARRDRQRAEADLAKMKAGIQARRQGEASDQQQRAATETQRTAEEQAQHQAEAEMAALQQAEQEATAKAAAEAEKKRQADAALAKAQAERKKADEEAAERRRAQEAAAATAETALKLGPTDRQRLQVALTAAGFDTRGTDGAFGPRSREMIANWQKARNQAATGFLDATQQQALLREASSAVASYDEAQKKPDVPAIVPAAAAVPAVPAPPPFTMFDGLYSGYVTTSATVTTASAASRPLTLRVANGSGTGTLSIPGCGNSPFALSISATGDVTGFGAGFPNCAVVTLGSVLPFQISGQAKGPTLTLRFTPSREKPYPAVLTRRGD